MVVCVIATDKGTGFIRTCTSCEDVDAQKYAKYYRSVGYNARVVTYEELEEIQEKETERRYAKDSTRLSNDDLWEKAGTNQPITRSDIGLKSAGNRSGLRQVREGLNILKK